MEKDLFIEVLKHYSQSSEQEALGVVALKENFPYSQVLHALSARVSKDHDFIEHPHELQLAAVYAADRSVLKDIMTLDTLMVAKPRRPEGTVKKKTIVRSVAPANPLREKVVSRAPEEPIETETELAALVDSTSGVADEVMLDLEKLSKLRHNFEALFNNAGEPEPSAPLPDIPYVSQQTLPEEIDSSVAEKTSRESAISKRERIIALARALEGENTVSNSVVVKVKTKGDNPGEAIIEEIVSTKEEIVPDNEKQKEQLEIIDQFIKIQPSIANSKDKPLPQPSGDLATIKTGEFSDNIVSETLVDILLKQGKNDKAIEVLKKLIWKFPQKKAYFAAQIEELKK